MWGHGVQPWDKVGQYELLAFPLGFFLGDGFEALSFTPSYQKTP